MSKRIDLDAIPPVPLDLAGPWPEVEPCLHFIAAWGPAHGPMAEAILLALQHNRELTIRNLRPTDVSPQHIEVHRDELENLARRFAREVSADSDAGDGAAALFGDQFERDHVAFNFAQVLLGPDPTLPPQPPR